MEKKNKKRENTQFDFSVTHTLGQSILQDSYFDPLRTYSNVGHHQFHVAYGRGILSWPFIFYFLTALQ